MKKLMEENNEYKVQHEKLGAWMSEGQAQFTNESDGDQSGKSEFQDCEDSVSPEFQFLSPHYEDPVSLPDLQKAKANTSFNTSSNVLSEAL